MGLSAMNYPEHKIWYASTEKPLQQTQWNNDLIKILSLKRKSHLVIDWTWLLPDTAKSNYKEDCNDKGGFEDFITYEVSET